MDEIKEVTIWGVIRLVVRMVTLGLDLRVHHLMVYHTHSRYFSTYSARGKYGVAPAAIIFRPWGIYVLV